MRTRRLKIFAPLLACLLVSAMSQDAAAEPSWGGNCTNCHDSAGGNLSISPDPIDIDIDSNGIVTFSILSNPGKGALALTGLDDAGLDASVLGGGWTNGGGYYYTNDFRGTAPRTLDLGIGPDAVEGPYGIGVQFAGDNGSEWASTYDFSVNVVPDLEADFDSDGDVDGDDFLAWQTGFGTPSSAQKSDGDYDNDGDVDGDDFLGWQSEFGSGSGSASAAVPEPTSVAMLVLMAATGMLARRGGCGRWSR